MTLPGIRANIGLMVVCLISEMISVAGHKSPIKYCNTSIDTSIYLTSTIIPQTVEYCLCILCVYCLCILLDHNFTRQLNLGYAIQQNQGRLNPPIGGTDVHFAVHDIFHYIEVIFVVNYRILSLYTTRRHLKAPKVQIFPGGRILIFFPENVKYRKLLCVKLLVHCK